MTNTAKTGGWNQVHALISVLRARVQATSIYGDRFTVNATFRIDRRDGAIRVDINTGLGPWEAIDGGQGVKTLAAAKALVTKWRAANAEQRTLSPKMAA